MTEREYRQKDFEYGRVVLDALRLQHSCELAGMRVQAAQAREIRRQASERQVALSLTSGPKLKQLTHARDERILEAHGRPKFVLR